MVSQAPVPHAEEMTISELADQSRLSQQELLALLSDSGFSVTESSLTFGEISAANGVAPDALYKAIGLGPQKSGFGGRRLGGSCGGEENSPGVCTGVETPRNMAGSCSHDGGVEAGMAGARHGGGRGYGRMTLAQLCDREGIDRSAALARLDMSGAGASVDQSVRAIADRMGVRPMEVVDILTGN